jgi:hypothetical protein
MASGVSATANSLRVALAVLASRDCALSMTETRLLKTVSLTLTSGITSCSGFRSQKRRNTSSTAASPSTPGQARRGRRTSETAATTRTSDASSRAPTGSPSRRAELNRPTGGIRRMLIAATPAGSMRTILL